MEELRALRKQSYLSEVRIFQDLSSEEMAALGRATPMKEVEAGMILYSPDDPAEVLFILKKGRVKLFLLTEEGRALTIDILEAGSIFGEMSLLGQDLHNVFAQALTPCVLCLMSREHVQRLLFSDPRIVTRITEELGKRLINAENRLLDFAFRRMPERLVRLLLQLAQPHRGLLSFSSTMEVRYTHEELADMIGTTRETVTKLLNAMRERGLVALQRGRIMLLDMNRLQQIASGKNSALALAEPLLLEDDSDSRSKPVL